MDLSNELKKFNKKLALLEIKLRVEKRGSLLGLRGPLPCRKTEGLFRSQRISLRLPANTESLKEAEKIIQLILFQINHGQFDWKHWISQKPQKNQGKASKDTCEEIKKFKYSFFSDPSRKRNKSGTQTTWTSAYSPYLRRLISISKDKNFELGKEVLLETLDSYEQNSRSKQQCATALGSFASYLGIELPSDWRTQSNGYGIHKARFRELPTDKQIKETWLRIPNPSWRMVFGLMATYGLRNHEVFFCDFSSLHRGGDHIIRVLPQTKTGEHEAWPFHPEWVESFELTRLNEDKNVLPKINVDLNVTTLQKVGKRVAEQFKRYCLPLTPYDLRHAWAVRTIHIGLPDTVAARMMGHSVAIHTRTYHHWITRRDQQMAVDAALSKKINQQ